MAVDIEKLKAHEELAFHDFEKAVNDLRAAKQNLKLAKEVFQATNLAYAAARAKRQIAEASHD